MVKIKKSKFLPPGTKRILHRCRIIDVLNSRGECRLVWISGHAAQGKTSLAATYVAQLPHPAVWINLEPAETDTVQFFKVLVEALRPVLSSKDFNYLASLPSVTVGVGAHNDRVESFSGPLLERLTAPVTIVLDDFHQLKDGAPSHVLVKELVFNSPETAHWLVLSKNAPPFSIEPLRVKQEAIELSNEALRFTVEEIQTLYEELWQIHLTRGQYETVQNATEGWTGGLILLAQTLIQTPEIRKAPDFDDFIGRQLTLDAFSFFKAEVLDPVSESTRDLLMQISVLPEINRNILIPLFDDPDIEQKLLEICDRHLFFSKSYDPDDGWIFRPHSLFREFLTDQWRRFHDEATRTDFLNRASRINLEKGYKDAAMQLLMLSGDMDSLSTVLIDEGLSLWFNGYHSELREYLEHIPQTFSETNPWLILYTGLTQRGVDPEAAFHRLHQSLTIFATELNIKGRIIAMAFLLETAGLSGYSPVPPVPLLEKAETFLADTPEASSKYPFETCCLWNQISLIRAYRGGSSGKRLTACRNSLSLAIRLEHPILQFHAHNSNVITHAITGNFSKARHHLDAMDRLVRAYPYPTLECTYYSALSLFYLFGGEPESASELPDVLEQFKQTIREHSLFFFDSLYRSHELHHAIFIKDFDKARRLGGDLLKHPAFSTVPFLKAFANMYLGMTHYKLRNHREAVSAFETAMAIFTSDNDFSEEHIHYILSYLGIVRIHLGEFEKAENALKSAFSYFRKSGNSLLRTDVLLAKALFAHRKNRSKTIPKLLDRAFKHIRDGGYRRMNIISDEDLAETACMVLEYEVEEAIEAAVHVLSHTPTKCLPPCYHILSGHKKKSVRETVFSVDAARHLRTRPILEIQTLGSFSVTRGNEKEPVTWPQPLIRKLFLAVLCHDGNLMTEMLMEILWPESTPEKQQRNFKVALHRLRKTIEPDMPKKHVSSYLKHDGNRLILNTDLYRLDADRFSALCVEAEAAYSEGDNTLALKHYKEALALYEDDFLPHDLHLPWTEPHRQRLGNLRQQAGRRAVGLLIRSRHLEEALTVYEQIVASGTTDEDIYLQMIKIHAVLGHLDAVHSTYRQLCTILRDELDAEPSMEITAAYQAIVHPKKTSNE